MKKAFTLIELLVVISIISVLASLVLTTVNSARLKARDVRRKSDLIAIRDAVETFNTENDRYPKNDPTDIRPLADCWCVGRGWITDGGKPGNCYSGGYDWSARYLPNQPHDPVDTCLWPWGNQGEPSDTWPTATYGYFSDNGQRYVIAARLENNQDDNVVSNSPYAKPSPYS